MKIDSSNLKAEKAPLFYQYDGQINPQPAYVEMDEEGNVSADYSGEIGNGTPTLVWHGRTLRWNVHPLALGSDLADLLESDEVKGLLKRVYAGHDVDWDGSNLVGRLDENAQEASEKLEEILAPNSGRYTLLEVWSASDWILEGYSLAELVEKGGIPEYAESFEAHIPDEQYVHGDMEDAVADRAGELIARHIAIETLPDDTVWKALEILVDYNPDQYGHLRDEYLAEFQPD